MSRYKGQNVTDKGEEASNRLDKSIEIMVKMGLKKIQVQKEAGITTER